MIDGERLDAVDGHVEFGKTNIREIVGPGGDGHSSLVRDDVKSEVFHGRNGYLF